MSFTTTGILDFTAPIKGYKNLRTQRQAEFNDFFTFAGKPELGQGKGDRARSHAFVIQVCAIFLVVVIMNNWYTLVDIILYTIGLQAD